MIYIILICMHLSLISYEYRFAIASKFRNEAPYLKEWIEYHRLIGTKYCFFSYTR